MSLYLTIIGAVLFFLIIVATFVLWLTSDLLVAVLASAAISLVSSLIFLILQAPDVAITEASIGAALTTGIFLYALKRVGRREND
ncbi:MAG: hydrogenase subunit MbhD domain-containing protein [Candidatus Hydrothermia bacterium]|jgi:uncharacterized MnhB-related membrane protein